MYRHADIDPLTVTYTGGRLDDLVYSVKTSKGRKKDKQKASSSRQSGEEENLAVIQAYTNLSKSLRQLDKLPLTITSVQGVSPVFRYAEVSQHTYNIQIEFLRYIHLINSYTMSALLYLVIISAYDDFL